MVAELLGFLFVAKGFTQPNSSSSSHGMLAPLARCIADDGGSEALTSDLEAAPNKDTAMAFPLCQPCPRLSTWAGKEAERCSC